MKNTWLVTLLTFSIFSSCIRKEISYLQLDGAEFATPLHSQVMLHQDSPFAPLMAVMAGDLVQLTNGEILLAKGLRDQTLKTRIDSTGKGYIDNKLYSLYISDETKKELVAPDNDEQFRTLGSVVLDAAMDDSVRGLLTRVAKQNKHLAITNNSDSSKEALPFLLNTFDPWFLLSAVNEKDLALLKKEQQLTHLVAYLTDSSVNYRLPNLKKLQLLSISSVNPLPDNFLGLNPDIKDLLISGQFNIRIVEPLKQLSSFTTDSPENLDMNTLKGFPLKRLVIMGDTSIPAKDLAMLHGLIWLGLPLNETQTAFDSLTKMLPNIEVVEMSAGDELYDLKWATRWNMLRTMNLYNADLGKVKGLEDMKQLKLLTFPFKTNKDLAKKLRKSLPDTTIIPNDGSCVGSFWLLLLAPLFIIFRIIRLKYITHA